MTFVSNSSDELTSSANAAHEPGMICDIFTSRGSMKIVKKVGPKIETCMTPDETEETEDVFFSKTTC